MKKVLLLVGGILFAFFMAGKGEKKEQKESTPFKPTIVAKKERSSRRW